MDMGLVRYDIRSPVRVLFLALEGKMAGLRGDGTKGA